MVNEDRILNTFLDLVRIDSPSREEEAIANELVNRLKTLGMNVEMDSMFNIFATLPGSGDPVLLMAHMDTVMPGRGVKPVVRDGVVYSDGTTVLGADPKSGVAAILEALAVIVEEGRPHPPLEVLITAQEEIGLLGARAFDKSKIHAHYGLSYDYGGVPGTLVVAAPGYNKIFATVHGKSAHAGVNPEDGINAIFVASEGISKMTLGRINERTAANIGVIHGGLASSTVPDRVEIQGMAWSQWDDQLAKYTDQMVNALKDAAARHGVTAEVEVNHSCDAYEYGADHPLVRGMMVACRAAGVESVLGFNGGATDANVLIAECKGLEIISPTTGMNKVHTTQECVAVKDMADCARMTVNWVESMAS